MERPDRLQLLRRALQPLMLRRTKQTRGADGQPMVGLPPKHVRVERVPLSAEEVRFSEPVTIRIQPVTVRIQPVTVRSQPVTIRTQTCNRVGKLA